MERLTSAKRAAGRDRPEIVWSYTVFRHNESEIDMAKKKAPKPKHVPLTKKQLSRKEKEDRWRFWLFVGTAVVSLSLVGVLGFGAYQEYVAKPASPVATVNGVPVRVDDYQRRIQYRRFDLKRFSDRLDAQMAQFDPTDESQQWIYNYLQQQKQQVTSNLMNLPTLVLDEMIDDQLVRQEADRRGLGRRRRGHILDRWS